MKILFLTLVIIFCCWQSSLAAVFPLIYLNKHGNLPNSLKGYLHAIKDTIPINERSSFEVYAFQSVSYLPYFKEGGWILVFRRYVKPSDSERYPETDSSNFYCFFVSLSGSFKVFDFPGLRFFVINLSRDSLAVVTIDWDGLEKRYYLGDSIDIQNLSDNKIVFSLYTNMSPGNPEPVYSQFYFWDFMHCGTIQIFQQEITFKYKLVNGVGSPFILSKVWKFYSLRNDGEYHDVPLTVELTRNYKRAIEKYPEMLACEKFPPQTISRKDFQHLGIKALDLDYGDNDPFY